MSEGNKYPELKSPYLREGGLTEMPKVIELTLVGKGENWEDSLAQAVMRLHDGVHREGSEGQPLPNTGIPPRLIFVTVTSAIPQAFAMRECWRTAYPNEDVPKFFWIDVSKQRFSLDKDLHRILTDEQVEEIKISEVERLRAIGERLQALNNTAVFDEFRNFGRTLRNIDYQLARAGFQDVNYMIGHWGMPITDWGIPEGARPFRRKGDDWMLGARFGGHPLPYRPIVPNVNPRSREVVDDMKVVGRLMANEILKHFQVSPANP